MTQAAPTALPFHAASRAGLARLRELLRASDFTDDAVAELMAAAAAGRGAAPRSAADALLRLLLDGEAFDWDVLRAHVAAETLDALTAAGLLESAGARGEPARATVMLYPVESLYLASDRDELADARSADALPDVVYCAGQTTTRRFLSMLPTSPCEHFLELCSGAAPAALLASAYARHAWAVDVTERATRFAEFNAALNAITNVTVLQGDLYEPVRGLTFDRIAAHPPYVPSLESRFIYREGGEDGEQITRRTIAGLPEFLRPGGRFYCTAKLTDRAGAPVERRVRDMLGPTQSEFDVFLAELALPKSPVEFYRQRADESPAGFAAVDPLHRVFTRLGVEALIYCTIVIERCQGPRRAFTVRRRCAPAAAAPHLEWALAWEAAAADPAFPRSLLEARPMLSPHAQVVMTHELRDGVLAPAVCALRGTMPFVVDVPCPLWAAPFLAHCDGASTVREQLAWLKAEALVSPATPEDAFAALVQSLVGAGILHIDLAPMPP